MICRVCWRLGHNQLGGRGTNSRDSENPGSGFISAATTIAAPTTGAATAPTPGSIVEGAMPPATEIEVSQVTAQPDEEVQQ